MSLQVAETIKKQIETIDRLAFARWGARGMMSMSNGGLMFFVCGTKLPIRSKIVIEYIEGDDLYNVKAGKTNMTTGAWVMFKRREQIQAIDLVNTIDAVCFHG